MNKDKYMNEIELENLEYIIISLYQAAKKMYSFSYEMFKIIGEHDTKRKDKLEDLYICYKVYYQSFMNYCTCYNYSVMKYNKNETYSRGTLNEYISSRKYLQSKTLDEIFEEIDNKKECSESMIEGIEKDDWMIPIIYKLDSYHLISKICE